MEPGSPEASRRGPISCHLSGPVQVFILDALATYGPGSCFGAEVSVACNVRTLPDRFGWASQKPPPPVLQVRVTRGSLQSYACPLPILVERRCCIAACYILFNRTPPTDQAGVYRSWVQITGANLKRAWPALLSRILFTFSSAAAGSG